MKIRRSLAGILAFAVLATCFTAMPIFATDDTKTKAELLDGRVEGKTENFATTFDCTNQARTKEGSLTIESIGDNNTALKLVGGNDITGVSGYSEYNWNNNRRQVNFGNIQPIDIGTAGYVINVRYKVETDSTKADRYWNMELRDKPNQVALNAGNMSAVSGQWNDDLIFISADNESIEVWHSADGGDFSKYTHANLNLATQNNNELFLSLTAGEGATIWVDYIKNYKYYTAGDQKSETELIGDLNVELSEKFDRSIDNVAKSKAGVTTIENGELVLDMTSDSTTAGAALNKTFKFTQGKKLSFKVKYDNYASGNSDIAEVQFYNGVARVCMVMRPQEIFFRNFESNKTIACQHNTSDTYQYFIEFNDGASGQLSDAYINVWRRTSDTDKYSFVGRVKGTETNTSEYTYIYTNAGSKVRFSDIKLYSDQEPVVTVGDQKTEAELIGDLNVELSEKFDRSIDTVAKSKVSDGTNQNASIENGELVLETNANQTAASVELNKEFNFTPGKKVSFKVKWDSLGTDSEYEKAEIQFINNGGKRICMVFTRQGVYFRDFESATKISNCTQSTNTTYQYLIEVNNDELINVWRRTSDDEKYTFMGSKKGSTGSVGTSVSTKLIGRENTKVRFGDVKLYGTGDPEPTVVTKTKAHLLGENVELQTQDFANGFDTGTQDRVGTGNVSIVESIDGAANALKLVGGVAEYLGSATQPSQININTSPMSLIDIGTNGYILGVRYKVEIASGSPNWMLNFRDNPNAITIDKWNSDANSGTWHEDLIFISADGTSAEVWQSANGGDFTKNEKITLGASTNITHFCLSAGTGATVYVDYIKSYGAKPVTPTPGPTPTPSEPTAGTTKTETELIGEMFMEREELFSTLPEYANKTNEVIEEGKQQIIKINNGQLQVKADENAAGITEFNLKDAFTFSKGKKIAFDVKFDKVGSGELGQVTLNGGANRICMVFKADSAYLRGWTYNGTNQGNLPNCTHVKDKTYHYLLELHGDGNTWSSEDYVYVWRRESTSDPYKFIAKLTGGGLAAHFGGSNSIFTACKGSTLSFDNVKLYREYVLANTPDMVAGTKATVDGLAVTANSTDEKLNIAGSMTIGSTKSYIYNRATVVTAGYNKEHGYTTYVGTKDYQRIDKAAAQSLVNTIDISSLDSDIKTALLTNDTLGVLIWDSMHDAENGTGIAYCDPTYNKRITDASVPSNNATAATVVGSAEGLTATARYNAVQLVGLVGKNETVTAMIKKGDALFAVAQAKANDSGVIDMSLSIDPYKNSGGDYTLCYQFGKNAPVSSTVKLYCTSDLQSAQITDLATFISFVNTYGNANEKQSVANNDFAQEAYDKFIEFGGMGSGGTFDFFGFPQRVSEAIESVTIGRAIVAAMNAATDHTQVKTIVVDTYGEVLGINEASYSAVSSPENLFRRMVVSSTRPAYTSMNDVKNAFTTALNAQIEAEKNPSGGNGTDSGTGGGIGGGGGGGTGSVGGVSISGSLTSNGNAASGEALGTVSGGTVSVFNDLESVPWAEESIIELRKKGILSGDGEGGYRPNDSITREEFLKLVMNALGITGGGDAEHFADVDLDEWYYEFVAAAFEKGIVTGTSGTTFGIGEKITRADMAVMLLRALTVQGKKLDGTKAAYVFEDFDKIPQYAQESITILAENELMNGVGDGFFAPADNATRAEAAVAIWRIYNYIREGE